MNAATTNMGSLTGQTCALQARCKGFNSPGLHWQALPWSNGQGATVRRWKWRFDSFWECSRLVFDIPVVQRRGRCPAKAAMEVQFLPGIFAGVPWDGRPLS